MQIIVIIIYSNNLKLQMDIAGQITEDDSNICNPLLLNEIFNLPTF